MSASFGLARANHTLEPHLRTGSTGVIGRIPSAATEDKNWNLAVIPIEAIEQAAGQLMSIGAELQVLEPVALRKYIRDLRGVMVASYSD